MKIKINEKTRRAIKGSQGSFFIKSLIRYS